MDLKKIIEDSGLKMEFIAAKLFPDNAHPYNALNRVLSKGGSLKAEQVKALAEVLNVSADELLGLRWSGKIGPSGVILKNGPVTVAITPSAGTFEVWFDGALRTFTLHSGMTVKGFLKEVEEITASLT